MINFQVIKLNKINKFTIICVITCSQFQLSTNLYLPRELMETISITYINGSSGMTEFISDNETHKNKTNLVIKSRVILEMERRRLGETKVIDNQYVTFKKNDSSMEDDVNTTFGSQNEDEFDFEYDSYEALDDEDNSGFQDMAAITVIFFMEIMATMYGLSYGIFAQINYFYHVNIVKDRVPQHLGSFNNVTIANP